MRLCVRFLPAFKPLSCLFISFAASNCLQAWAEPMTLADPSNQAAPARKELADNAKLMGSSTKRFFKDAAEKGMYFRAGFNEEIAGNVSGGLRKGVTASEYATVGMDLDLQKMMGWNQAALHWTVIALHSKGLNTEYIGGGVDSQENFAPFNLVRFLNLTLEQRFSLLHDNDLNVIVGRMGALPYFAQSELTCQFMSHAFCGVLYGFPQSTGTAVAPVSSWGGRVKFSSGPRTYVQAGAFVADDTTFDDRTGLFDVGTQHIHGTNYMAETGYETHFTDEVKPRYYRLGISYLDARRSDVLLNTEGRERWKHGGNPKTQRGETAVYLTAGQVLQRPDVSSRRNLSAFGSVYYNLDDAEAIQYTVKGGLVETGTFQGRDEDTIGLAVSQIRFSGKEVDYLSGMRSVGGGHSNASSHEEIVELNYGIHVSPGVVVLPNIQYTFNPDTRYTPTSPRGIPDTLVLGLQLNISLDKFFGLPHMMY